MRTNSFTSHTEEPHEDKQTVLHHTFQNHMRTNKRRFTSHISEPHEDEQTPFYITRFRTTSGRTLFYITHFRTSRGWTKLIKSQAKQTNIRDSQHSRLQIMFDPTNTISIIRTDKRYPHHHPTTPTTHFFFFFFHSTKKIKSETIQGHVPWLKLKEDTQVPSQHGLV